MLCKTWFDLSAFVLVQIVGPSPSPGTPLTARILDVSKDTGIVDVTLKPTLMEASAAAAVSSKGGAAEEDGKGDNKAKKSKKRKAEEALDAAHAADSSLKVSVHRDHSNKPLLSNLQTRYDCITAACKCECCVDDVRCIHCSICSRNKNCNVGDRFLNQQYNVAQHDIIKNQSLLRHKLIKSQGYK